MDFQDFRRSVEEHCLAAIDRVENADEIGGSASSGAQIIDLYTIVHDQCPLTNDLEMWNKLYRTFEGMVLLGIEPLLQTRGGAKFSGYIKFLGMHKVDGIAGHSYGCLWCSVGVRVHWSMD